MNPINQIERRKMIDEDLEWLRDVDLIPQESKQLKHIVSLLTYLRDNQPGELGEDSAKLNTDTATKIADQYAVDGTWRRHLREDIYTALQIAQKRGEILERIKQKQPQSEPAVEQERKLCVDCVHKKEDGKCFVWPNAVSWLVCDHWIHRNEEPLSDLNLYEACADKRFKQLETRVAELAAKVATDDFAVKACAEIADITDSHHARIVQLETRVAELVAKVGTIEQALKDNEIKEGV